MSTGDIVNPVSDVRFAVEVADQIVAWFTECSGLDVQREIKSQPEGGINDRVHQLPGRLKHSNIKLKRGISDDTLWQWFHEGMYDGKVSRKHVSILLFNTDRSEVKRWNLRDAYPIKWTGPTLKADSNGVSFETLELVHHGLEMVEWAAL